MYKFKTRARHVLLVLIYTVLLFSALSLIGRVFEHFLGYTDIPILGFLQLTFLEEFNLDNESNITTYFAGILLLLSSILLWLIAYIERERNSPFYRHWFGLSLVFAYISVDEVATLHERIARPVRELLGAEGIFYFSWVIPAAVGLLLLGIVYARFLWHLQARWKALFSVAAALYVGGALGLELVGGWYVSEVGESFAYESSFTYELLVTVEETLEMAGAAFFIYSLLDYLSRRVDGVAFAFQSAPDQNSR